MKPPMNADEQDEERQDSFMRGLVTSFRTLTIFPVPGKDTDKFASSLYWFPLVGLTLGMLLYAVVLVVDLYTNQPWIEGVSVLLVVVSIIMTRGLHLDGLSDWADGFWGSHERERILAIMKDSAIGTFGGAALVMLLLTKYVCFVRLLDTSSTYWIPVAYVVSRTMQAVIASSHPYARKEGGTGHMFIQGAGRSHRFAVLALSIVLVMIVGGMTSSTLFVFLGACLLTVVFGRWSNSKLGGVTGDIIGATSELTEVFVLVAGASLG